MCCDPSSIIWICVLHALEDMCKYSDHGNLTCRFTQLYIHWSDGSNKGMCPEAGVLDRPAQPWLDTRHYISSSNSNTECVHMLYANVETCRQVLASVSHISFHRAALLCASKLPVTCAPLCCRLQETLQMQTAACQQAAGYLRPSCVLLASVESLTSNGSSCHEIHSMHCKQVGISCECGDPKTTTFQPAKLRQSDQHSHTKFHLLVCL
jgi:hypothetical protein